MPSNEYMVFHTRVFLCVGIRFIQSTAVSNGASARKEDALIHHFQFGLQPPGGIWQVVKPDHFYTTAFGGKVSDDQWQNWRQRKASSQIFAYHWSMWLCEFNNKGDLQGTWGIWFQMRVFPQIGCYFLYITLVAISCERAYNTLQIKVRFLMALKLLLGMK